MPGPPIRKPSDHSPPAGSPRNIAGHHVLHRPLMPRHPPNAQKNKQQKTHEHNQEQNTHQQAPALSNQFAEIITVRCSRPLYSSQPTHPHPPTTPNKSGAPDRSGNQGALPQNPDSMPPPHTNARRGTHHQQTTTTTTAAAAHHSGRVSHASTRQTNHPREQTHETQSTARPFRKGRPPSRPRPIQQSEHDQNSQEATPAINP